MPRWPILAIAMMLAIAVLSPGTPPEDYSGLLGEPEEEKPRRTWEKIDHSDLFLIDLTAKPATYVVAFVVDEAGEITRESADIYSVLFAPMQSEIIAARLLEPMELETDLDETIIMNKSDKTIVAYFQSADELHEIRLLGGEGVALGELPLFAQRRFKTGCKCYCDSGEGLTRVAKMFCEEVIENGTRDKPCDCDSLEDMLCYGYDDEGELFEGTIQNCRSGLLAGEHGLRRGG